MGRDESKESNKSGLLPSILLGVLLLASNGAWYFFYQQLKGESTEKIEIQKKELIGTYSKLDSISVQLDLRIDEIERLGGDIDSLVLIREELEREKKELINAKGVMASRLTKLQEKVSAYETLLKNKDAEIERLKEVNDYLLHENYTLKEEKNELSDQIVDLTKERGKLESKISSASSLKAINLAFTAINAKGKKRDGAEFKVKHLNKLSISFNLDDNPLAEIGTKTIYIRLIEPEGAALYNISNGSGTFVYQGSEIFYTGMQDILFDNTQQQVRFYYEKGSDFKKGQHRVIIYADGEVIGEKSFIVK